VLLALATAMFGWSFMVPQQARLVRQTPQRQSVVLSLNAAAIYVGASIGSAIGGAIVAGYGLEALGYASAFCWLLALLHLAISEKVAPRPEAQAPARQASAVES
jgi:predicted MFS family arabinose efflux permease